MNYYQVYLVCGTIVFIMMGPSTTKMIKPHWSEGQKLVWLVATSMTCAVAWPVVMFFTIRKALS